MITSLKLTNFRNFSSTQLSFRSGINAIVAPNASGKTNILEGIYLLSTGKSFKAQVETEMINYESDMAKIEGKVESEKEETSLSIFLTRGDKLNGVSGVFPRKKMLINNAPKRLVDFANQFKVVLFGPWDLDLVTGSPTLRRTFLNIILSQTDREYYRSLLSYEKGLRQRNRLLLRIREEGLSRSQLLFWDRLIIKNGDYISNKRQELINYVNEQPGMDDQQFKIEYDNSVISEARLEQYKNEEVAAATTLVGPHRDDFIFNIASTKSPNSFRNLSKYGSRGEQRMGVLWLKLSELRYSSDITKTLPTLILDDIFSELDHPHRDIVVETISKQQSIITTADPHYLSFGQALHKIEI